MACIWTNHYKRKLLPCISCKMGDVSKDFNMRIRKHLNIVEATSNNPGVYLRQGLDYSNPTFGMSLRIIITRSLSLSLTTNSYGGFLLEYSYHLNDLMGHVQAVENGVCCAQTFVFDCPHVIMITICIVGLGVIWQWTTLSFMV